MKNNHSAFDVTRLENHVLRKRRVFCVETFQSTRHGNWCIPAPRYRYMSLPVGLKADSLAFLSTLQSWQLKRLAFLTGLNSTGTKAQLRSTISESLARPSLASSHADASGCRVLSVDMGVKNLAFCSVDLRRERQSGGSFGQIYPYLSHWKRLDISKRLIEDEYTPRDGKLSSASPTENESEEIASTEQLNLYTPSSLSKIAFKLASEFIRHQPNVILIERQRFRSGGAPAIQEWTVRVNMLESMLWAALETMRHGHGGKITKPDLTFPEVREMNPRRIGMFWLGRGEDTSPNPTDVATDLSGPKEKVQANESTLAKRSFEKKDKIALVRRWLHADSPDLPFDPELATMVESFCSPRSRSQQNTSKRRLSKKGNNEGDDEGQLVGSTTALSNPNKLDDLADCLVQAVTFALWEQNRVQILDYMVHAK